MAFRGGRRGSISSIYINYVVNEIVVNEICWHEEKWLWRTVTSRLKGLNAPKRMRQLVSYCHVAVIKLMEITRVGARQVKEKCREQGK